MQFGAALEEAVRSLHEVADSSAEFARELEARAQRARAIHERGA